MSQHLVTRVAYQYFVLWLKVGGGYPFSWIWKWSLMKVVFITLPKCWWISMCFWGIICWRFGFQTYLFLGRWCDFFSRHEQWCDNVVKWKTCTFVVGVHCMTHRCNLVVGTLSNLFLIGKIKALLHSIYTYFAHFLKQHMKYGKLEKIMETKGLKILCNI